MIDENLVKPFIEQYDFVREYIAEKERIVIGTGSHFQRTGGKVFV